MYLQSQWALTRQGVAIRTPGRCCVTGYGGISLAVEGPSKVDIQTEDLEDGTCKVSYFPTVPGVYIVSTKFADEHVPGTCSPLPSFCGALASELLMRAFLVFQEAHLP